MRRDDNAVLIVEFAKVRTDKGMDAKSSAARNDTGTAVVSGMLAATFIGIFLIPVFFVIVRFFAAKFNRS